ncbi:MAG: tetratricopeptide repeat protein [Bacteroidales bacterium]|nr:tetratricopeptide repeat protein [Bacteroidales bacterium]
MSILRNKKTRALIIIMIALVITGILIAKIYYSSENRSVDPRVIPARELYAGYDEYAREGDYHKIFALLDSVQDVYDAYPHYRQSYETGVIYNNRAAALITIALFGDSIQAEHNPWHGESTDSLLTMAERYIERAIAIYDSWLEDYEGLDREEVMAVIEPGFSDGLDTDNPDRVDRYLEKRAEEIIMAVKETDRRLSVCYTNLGVIKRQRKEYEEAVRCYEKAISLWDRNLSAENNLNALLGRPLKKRNIIQKLFPPER